MYLVYIYFCPCILHGVKGMHLRALTISGVFKVILSKFKAVLLLQFRQA